MGRGILSNQRRRTILERDGTKCRACGTGITVVLQIHHVVPVELGGHDADDNLAVVCANCHDLIHHFGSKKQFPKALADLQSFGVSKAVADRIERLAASIANARHEGAVTGRVTPRGADGEPIQLPTLAEAIALCAKKNRTRDRNFTTAVTKLIEHIPEVVASKCAFRLTHQDKSIGVNMMNYLLVRAPARPDVGRHKGATGVFVIAPTDSRLAKRYDVGFKFTGFLAVNIWCEHQDVLGWKKADWRDFERGCEMAAAAPKSRSWLSNIAVK